MEKANERSWGNRVTNRYAQMDEPVNGATGPAPFPGLSPDTTREEWLDIGRRLGERTERDRWALGDWARHGDRRYGDLTEAASVAGLAYGTLANLASVSRRIKPSRRREGLSWDHHAAVAALPPATGDDLLGRAVAGGWSSRVMREEARAASQVEKLKSENRRLKDRLARTEAGADGARDEAARMERRLRRAARQLPDAYREFFKIIKEAGASPALGGLHGNARRSLVRRFRTIIDGAANVCSEIAEKQIADALRAIGGPKEG